MARMTAGRQLIFGLIAIIIAGCGGGGGGSSGGSQNSAPQIPVDPDAPTFEFGSSYTNARSNELALEVLENGGRLLDYAQFATDLAHRFVGPNSPATVTANCAYSGRITLGFDDRDGNKRASAGDVITAVLENCGVPNLARAATGTLRVDIVAASPTVDVGLKARLTVMDALKMTGFVGGPNTLPIKARSLRGSLGVEWSESSTGSLLRAISSAEDDLSQATSKDGGEQTDGLRKIDVSRTLSYEGATISSAMAFLLDIGNSRKGILRVRSPQAMQGDWNVLPRQMRIEAEMAGAEILRVERGVPVGGLPQLNTVVVASGGVASAPRPTAWGDFLSMQRDPRQNSQFNTWSDQGGGYVAITPWRSADNMLEIDRICQQGARPVTGYYEADALFQRPVALQTGLSEPGAVLKLQFGRAIAADIPELRYFRFVDRTEGDMDPMWDVPITVQRRGASFDIRLAEPIRRGRNYVLQSSADGVNWYGDRVIRDAQNEIVNQGGEGFALVSTDSTLTANTLESEETTMVGSAPARLRGGARLRDGQTITRYQWEQISGVPLRLTSPQAAETDAVLEGSSPQIVGEAVMQLTVTDSRGDSDRARVRLMVGNYAPQGALLYSVRGSTNWAPWRSMSTGPGSIFVGPEPGYVGARLLALGSGGTGVSFGLIPANGQRLAVGIYANTIRSETAGPLHVLQSHVFCNTVGSPLSGWFQVLDVLYATDGSITRLAIDFRQQCDAGFIEFEKGSYRYNSTIPISP